MSDVNVRYIPPHTRCVNCGECCEPVPITIDDYARISNYLQGNSYAREVVRRKHEPLQCVFRDDVQRKCAIYSVRPMVCRLFGVAKGMTCSHGNSAEIDCAGLIDFSQTFCGCQNGMGWNVSEGAR